MPIRRLNFTGRKRLNRSDISIRLREVDGSYWFDADLQLDAYDLPSDALLFVEAYRQYSRMRFSYGTVGSRRPPADRALTEFTSADGVLFDVKVVQDTAPHGLLIAKADRIQPTPSDREAEERESLLPVRPDPGLEEEVFRVYFSDDRPVLLVNEEVGNWREFTRQPAFMSLVSPELLRAILRRILHVEDYRDTDDSEDWRSQWLKFATALAGAGPLPEQSADHLEDEDWIEHTVAAFCRQHAMMHNFGKYWTEEESR